MIAGVEVLERLRSTSYLPHRWTCDTFRFADQAYAEMREMTRRLAKIAPLFGVILVCQGLHAHAACCHSSGLCGVVDEIANIDQRQPPGTCSIRNMSKSACDAISGYFKPDFGSGFTECFFPPAGPSSSPSFPPLALPKLPPPQKRPPSVDEQASGSVTFVISNSAGQTIDLKFFSQDRQWFWPGKDSHWVLKSGEERTYGLNCNIGEKVCYGGYDSGDGKWGVGRNNGGCKGCCLICARSSEKKTLARNLTGAKKKVVSEKAPAPAATDWCSSVKLGNAKGCISKPTIGGPNTYSFRLDLTCPHAKYMAAIAAYDANGQCKRKVVTIPQGGSDFVTSSKIPGVLDAIIAKNQKIQACYFKRHNGKPCKG